METNNNEVLEQNNMENGNVVTNQNVVQNEMVDNTNNNFEQNNKKNFMGLIGIAMVFVLLAVGGVFASSAFKSDEEKFFDLLFNKQSAVMLIEELNEKAMKDGQVNSSLEIDFNEIVEAAGEDLGFDLALSLNVSQGTKKDNTSGSMGIKLNKDDLVVIEYAQTDDLFGLRVKDTTEKFIAIQNKDLDKLMEKFGVTDIGEMPDRMLTQEDFEKVIKMKKSDVNRIGNKYLKVLANSSKDRVKVEKNVEIEIDDKEIKTTKYTFELTERAMMDMAVAIVKELKDDKKNINLVMNDLKAVLELLEENGYPVEDMYGIDPNDLPETDEIIEMLEEAYNKAKEKDLNEFDDEEALIIISVYEYKGKAVVTEFENEDETKLIFKSLVDKELFISLSVEEEKEEIAAFIFDGEFNDKELDLKFIIKAEGEKLEVFSIKQEYKNKAENFVELSEKNALILNDASEEELEEYATEFMEGAEKLVENLQDVIPEELIEVMNSSSAPSYDYDTDFEYEVDYDDDFDYDIDPDFSYTPPVDVTLGSGTTAKGGMLAEAQAMYNKVNIGDSKESVIQKLGQPDDTRDYEGMFTYLTWKSDIKPNEDSVEIVIYEGRVDSKEIMIYPDKYYGILFADDLNTQIEDLNQLSSKVKEGMTLQEVKAILGNACYQSELEYDGYSQYTWVDKNEKSIDISFDEDGKVFYVGHVW